MERKKAIVEKQWFWFLEEQKIAYELLRMVSALSERRGSLQKEVGVGGLGGRAGRQRLWFKESNSGSSC